MENMKAATIKLITSIVVLMMSINVHAQVNELKRLVFEMNKVCPIETNMGYQLASFKYVDNNLVITYTSDLLDFSSIKNQLAESKEAMVRSLIQNEESDALGKLIISTNSGVVLNFQGINNSSCSIVSTPEEVRMMNEKKTVSLTGRQYVQHYVTEANRGTEATVKLLSDYGVTDVKFEIEESFLYIKYVINNTDNFNVIKQSFDANSYFITLLSADPNLAKQLIAANMGIGLMFVDSSSGKKHKTTLNASDIKKTLNY